MIRPQRQHPLADREAAAAPLGLEVVARQRPRVAAQGRLLVVALQPLAAEEAVVGAAEQARPRSVQRQRRVQQEFTFRALTDASPGKIWSSALARIRN